MCLKKSVYVSRTGILLRPYNLTKDA